MDSLPPPAIPGAAAGTVVGIDQGKKDLTLAEETDLHNYNVFQETEARNAALREEKKARDKLLHEEKMRKIQESGAGFLAELEKRVTQLHAHQLQKAKAARTPLENFRLFYGDLCEQFPMLDHEAIIVIFTKCQAANGFDINTSIAFDGKGVSIGDRTAEFHWKGRDSKVQVRYRRDGHHYIASPQ